MSHQDQEDLRTPLAELKGKNFDLLGQLGLSGKVKCKGNLVLSWPQTAIVKGGDPIVLRT